MNKKLIRLTESDLHRIVKESVNRVLYNEGLGDRFRGAWNGFKQGAEQQNYNEVRSDVLATVRKFAQYGLQDNPQEALQNIIQYIDRNERWLQGND